MLDAVELRNFKSFRNERIALERLTVFVGANASGKISEGRFHMRWHLRLMVLGLLAGALSLPAFAGDKKKPGECRGLRPCGDYGTSVHFEKSPKDAAKKALKEEKLVMVLHISGLFENTDYT